MMTFLPYPCYEESAACLDRLRLGKQRHECLTIVNALLGYNKGGWLRHPICRIWRGYERQLIAYSIDVCNSWIQKGYQDSVKDKLLHIAAISSNEPDWNHRPDWITKELCLSHQSNLIRKLPDHYIPIFGADIPNDLPYIWPIP